MNDKSKDGLVNILVGGTALLLPCKITAFIVGMAFIFVGCFQFFNRTKP